MPFFLRLHGFLVVQCTLPRNYNISQLGKFGKIIDSKVACLSRGYGTAPRRELSWELSHIHRPFLRGKALFEWMIIRTSRFVGYGWWFGYHANHLIGSLIYPIIYWSFIHPRWLAGFLNHQQYQRKFQEIPCENLPRVLLTWKTSGVHKG